METVSGVVYDELYYLASIDTSLIVIRWAIFVVVAFVMAFAVWRLVKWVLNNFVKLPL